MGSSSAQAGGQGLELRVGDDATPAQLRQLPEPLGRVRRRLAGGRGRATLGSGRCRRESSTNLLLGPGPALSPAEPRIEVICASRDGDVPDHLTEKGHRGDSTARPALLWQ